MVWGPVYQLHTINRSMRVHEILNENLFHDGWFESAERMSQARGPKFVADMWSNHRRYPEIAKHLRANLEKLGPAAKEAAKLFLKWVDSTTLPAY